MKTNYLSFLDKGNLLKSIVTEDNGVCLFHGFIENRGTYYTNLLIAFHIVKGGVTFVVDDIEYEVGKSMTVLIDARSFFTIQPTSTELEVLILQFDEEILVRTFDSPIRLSKRMNILDARHQVNEPMFKLMHNLVYLERGSYCELIRSLFKGVSYDNSQKMNTDIDNTKIEGVIENIIDDVYHDELSSETSNLRYFSDKYAISYSHISRTFGSYVGMNFVQFQRIVKVQKATLLLIHEERNMDRVIGVTGFSEVRTLSHWFKYTYGLTPKKFINEYFKNIVRKKEMLQQCIDTQIIRVNAMEKNGKQFAPIEVPINLKKEAIAINHSSWGRVTDINSFVIDVNAGLEKPYMVEMHSMEYIVFHLKLLDGKIRLVYGENYDRHLNLKYVDELTQKSNNSNRVIRPIFAIHMSQDLISLDNETIIQHLRLTQSNFLSIWANINLVGSKYLLWTEDACELTNLHRVKEMKEILRSYAKPADIGIKVDIECLVNKQVSVTDYDFFFASLDVAYEFNQVLSQNVKDLNHIFAKSNRYIYYYLMSQTDVQSEKESLMNSRAYCDHAYEVLSNFDVPLNIYSYARASKASCVRWKYFTETGLETYSYYYSLFFSQIQGEILYSNKEFIVAREDEVFRILLKPASSFKNLKLILSNFEGLYKRTEYILDLDKLEDYYEKLESVSELILRDDEQMGLRSSVSPNFMLSLDSVKGELSINHQLNYTSIRFLQFEKI